MITGGAGFIGSAFIRHLVTRTNHLILNYDKLTYSAAGSALAGVEADPRYSFVQGDICDGERVAAALAQFRPEAVINLAAETHVDRSIDGPEEFIRTNLLGTFTLLEQVRAYLDGVGGVERSAFRFHHVSTDEVFGSLGEEGHFDESARYDPRSPYSATKAGSDHLVHAWGHTYGLPFLVSYSCNNYGPYQFPEKLVPLTIARALSGASLPVFGDGQNIRDWLFVDDHARALQEILERGKPGETYAISGGFERSNIAMVRAVCGLLDRARPLPAGRSYADQIEFVADRPGHDRRYALDASKIRKQLDWRAEITIEEGLGATVDWYMANESWWGPLVRQGFTERAGTPAGERMLTR